MNRHDLYEGINEIEDKDLERSEQDRQSRIRRFPRWMGGVAAVLVAAVAGVALLHPGGGSVIAAAHAIEQPVYPTMAPYPQGEGKPGFDEKYEAWKASVTAQRQEESYLEQLSPFFVQSTPHFFSDTNGKNRAYSPLNVYMALSVLAELTDANSRQQILDVLHTDSIEALRTQTHSVWNGSYRSDGATFRILANALWLNEDIAFDPDTLKTLAQTYYASSYQGKMGSEEMDGLLQNWLNEQTGSLLEDTVQGLTLDPDTVLALTSTIRYQAKWAHSFMEESTAPAIFHAPSGEITCDFMNQKDSDTYYWSDQFGAVGKRMENDGGTMWFLLPDEGVSPEELLQGPAAMEFLLNHDDWKDSKYLTVNLSVPKFDITSELDLTSGLKSLGITDVFDANRSDFSPMTTQVQEICLSQAKHDVRVAIDEEGVTAAAYTMMVMTGAGAPPNDSIDFVLDRPFVFAITSDTGLPLFVGVVNQPNA